MDRGRHRALLKSTLALGMVTAGLFAGAGTTRSQAPAGPVPSVAVPPPAPNASAAPDAARKRAAAEKAMVERRQRDLGVSEQEAQRRIEQLPPEEREAFKRNLRVWRELSPEERENVRKDENERIRAEIDKALQQSGLHLDKDQREVFALRYRQERRKLERELQEKLEAERARRLPGIIDGLKREFADRAGRVLSRPPQRRPRRRCRRRPGSYARSTPSVSVPAASPTP